MKVFQLQFQGQSFLSSCLLGSLCTSFNFFWYSTTTIGPLTCTQLPLHKLASNCLNSFQKITNSLQSTKLFIIGRYLEISLHMSVQKIKRHYILLTARERLAALKREPSIVMQGKKGEKKILLFSSFFPPLTPLMTLAWFASSSSSPIWLQNHCPFEPSQQSYWKHLQCQAWQTQSSSTLTAFIRYLQLPP